MRGSAVAPGAVMSQEGSASADGASWWLIPPTILARRDLSVHAKALVGQIVGLVSAQGCCGASNAWLGAQLGLSKHTVSQLVGRLAQKGLLDVVVKRDQTGQVTGRVIGLGPRLLAEGSGDTQ